MTGEADDLPDLTSSSLRRATLADRLRAASQGQSARSLSRLAGLPYSTVGNVFRGTSPTADTLAALSRALTVSIGWLVTGQGSPYPDPPPSYALDNRLMGLALERVKALYTAEHARLDDRSAGELAARVYTSVLEMCDGSDDPGDHDLALRLVLSRLRRDLVSTGTEGRRKRQD